MCICCHCGLNLGGLEFWTILLIIALLPCTKHSRLALSEKKPKSFTTLQNGIDLFFCHFLVLIAVLCAQHRSLGPLGATDSLLSAFPHHSSSLSWSLAGVSLTGGLFTVCLSQTCRKSFASFHMYLSRNGAVSEMARAALLLGQSGWGCSSPAMLC